MAERKAQTSSRSPVERLAAIEQGQARLLAELDELNARVESALADFAPPREASPADA